MPASRFTFIYNLHSASRKPRTGYLRAVRVQASHRVLYSIHPGASTLDGIVFETDLGL